MISRSYKYRFYPTQAQAQQLAKEFGCARFVWNWGLAKKDEVFKTYGSRTGSYELSAELAYKKKLPEFEWLNDCVATCHTQVLADMNTAFKHFFRRIKEGKKGKKAGFPKFKKKGDKQSVRYQLDQRRIAKIYQAGQFLVLPKLGSLKLAWSRIPKGIPKMATVSRDCAGRYWVSMSVTEEIKQLPMKTKSVGIDVGVKDVAVTSDGYHSGAPKFTRKYERKLKRLQRKAARALRKNNPLAFTKGAPKKKGEKLKVKLVRSNRDKKLMVRINKVHAKIADCRKDWLHKLSHKIVKENSFIGMETLNVEGMLKNRHLSKAVQDSGLYELKRQIEYKAEWHGRVVVGIDRFFPSTKMCSACGQLHDMPLKVRTMRCDCGLVLDRDENAAINILNEAVNTRRKAYAKAA